MFTYTYVHTYEVTGAEGLPGTGVTPLHDVPLLTLCLFCAYVRSFRAVVERWLMLAQKGLWSKLMAIPSSLRESRSHELPHYSM